MNQPAYLVQMFNVTCLYTSTLKSKDNILARLLDAFIEGMNRKAILPKHIIVMLDRDLIDQFQKFDTDFTRQFQRNVKWFATQMDRLLEARKDVLQQRRPGVLHPDIYPTVIWVEMFDRPFRSGDPAFDLMNKFNKALNDVATHHKNYRILEVSTALQ